jgi:uncharacterized membrane protein YozB (DUF420 family)
MHCRKKHLKVENEFMTIFRNSRVWAMALICLGLFCLMAAHPAMAQALESRISQTIESLTRIVNVLIVGFVVWSGFLIAKGDESGFGRLIYGVIGLVVANASYLIISYFR